MTMEKQNLKYFQLQDFNRNLSHFIKHALILSATV